MEIKYCLTKREIEFLKALSEKEYPKFAWSGRRSDDHFMKEWDVERKSFTESGLTEKKDSGSEFEYWCYGLNKKGMALFNIHFPEAK